MFLIGFLVNFSFFFSNFFFRKHFFKYFFRLDFKHLKIVEKNEQDQAEKEAFVCSLLLFFVVQKRFSKLFLVLKRHQCLAKNPSLSLEEVEFIDALREPTPNPNNPYNFELIPLHTSGVPKSRYASQTGYYFNDRNYGYEVRKTWRTNREGIVFQAVKTNRWVKDHKINREYTPQSTWEVFYPEFKTKRGNYIYNPDRFCLENCNNTVKEATTDSMSCFLPFDGVPTKLKVDGKRFEKSKFNIEMVKNMNKKPIPLAAELNLELHKVPTGLKRNKHSGPKIYHRLKMYGGKNLINETIQIDDKTQKIVNREIVSVPTYSQNFANHRVIRPKSLQNGFTEGQETKLKFRPGNTIFKKLTSDDNMINTTFRPKNWKKNYHLTK